MKTLRKLIWIILLYPSLIYAQKNSDAYRVGSVQSFIQRMPGSPIAANDKSNNQGTVTLQLSPNESVVIDLNLKKTNDKTKTFAGKVRNQKSKFNLFHNSEITEGSLIMEDGSRAYKLYADQNDNLYSKEVSLDELLCVGMEKQLFSNPKETTVTLPPGQNIYELQSYPLASAVVLLDFDGQYVPSGPWGDAIDAPASTLSIQEKFEAWQLVSEDFRPFNLNITTNEAVFFNAPPTQRMRVIFTSNDQAYPGAGGVAFIGSFVYGDDFPCWVYNTGGKAAGETASHEIGHTLDLFHDGVSDGTNYEEYYWGNSVWGPIMGASFGPEVVQWSKGEYINANNFEDDLSKIASERNGFGYRVDDAGNTISTATSLILDNNGVVSPDKNNGNIETNSDVDVYSFTTSGGTTTFTIAPAVHSNLHVKLEIRDASNNLITTLIRNKIEDLGFGIHFNPGKYFLLISGTGYGDPLDLGYTDYGSLGFYSISGSVPVGDNFRNPENPSNTVTGVDYKYFEGNWSYVPDFAGLTPVKTNVDTNFVLTSRNRNDSFGYSFTAFLNIPTDGIYTFYTNSDDGSKLFIGSQLVVDNDGLHPLQERSGSIGLKAGKHAIKVEYFELSGGQVLDVYYSGPTISKRRISSTQLYRINIPSYRNPENPSNIVNGLNYEYYEGSDWNTIPNFNSLLNQSTGNFDNFSLASRKRNDNFGYSFNGFVEVMTDGMYTFYTNSDDGSRLYIGTTLVVDNDGLHSDIERSGTIGLKAGKHAIRVDYFERTGDEVLGVKYEGPGLSKQSIPSNRLFRIYSSTLRDAENPGALTSGLSFKYFEGTGWTSVQDFATFLPVKTGTSSDFSLTQRNRDDNFGFEFNGYIQVSADGYYNFFTNSDDGSKLFIGSREVVSNDGLHANEEKSGMIGLKQGKHAIKVVFFERTGGEILEVRYEGPGIGKQLIPATQLFRSSSSASVAFEESINFYPNPTHQDINVEMLNNNIIHEVSISDVFGNIVKVVANDDARLTIDVSDLILGVYTVRIKTSETVHTKLLKIE